MALFFIGLNRKNVCDTIIWAAGKLAVIQNWRDCLIKHGAGEYEGIDLRASRIRENTESAIKIVKIE